MSGPIKAADALVRLELKVPDADVHLIRRIAAALTDPTAASDTRTFLNSYLGLPSATDAKKLLLEAPLEGVDLERPRDFGPKPRT
jgi:hypothetical protein